MCLLQGGSGVGDRKLWGDNVLNPRIHLPFRDGFLAPISGPIGDGL